MFLVIVMFRHTSRKNKEDAAMRLTKAYKINDKVQIVEYTNTARKNESEPKYEYYLRIELDSCKFIREEFSFGCNSKIDFQNLLFLLGQGYFNHEIDLIMTEYLEVK